MKVLVAEDTRSIRMIISATVTEAGHETIEVDNGVEAVRQFKESGDIDLILMDAEMPEMDGFEATCSIRKFSEDDWVPIVFLSAHEEDDYVQRALDTGADVYLRKPLNSVQLLGQIRAMERIAAMKARLSEMNAELQNVNAVLESMARVDGLTGVSNRRSFDERIDVELARCKRNRAPLSLILCDIDCFKQYNDTYGHLAGDGCLKKVARAIDKTFGRATDMVARYGGEEFVVMLPDTGEDDAYRMARTMLSAVTGLEIPHRTSKALDIVSISVGVACADGIEELTKTDLISRADGALYNAKDSGRNQAILATTEGVCK